mgnify:CR=1 FL=1
MVVLPTPKATRVFRGVRYLINVTRAGKGSSVQLTVDGNSIEGAVIPLPPAGTEEVKEPADPSGPRP